MEAHELTQIETIITQVHDTISTSVDVEYYCQLKYSKSPQVFLGIDEDNPPVPSDYPVIVVFSISRSARGESNKFLDYEVVIGVGIINDSKTVDGKKIIYPGLLEAEHLRELVESSLFCAGIAHKTDVGAETYSDVIFPLFRSDTKIRLSFLQTSRTSVK